MKEVKVNTGELRAKVKANREKHITDHKDAMEGYQEKVVQELSKALKIAKANNTEVNLNPVAVLNTTRPASYVKDYDRAIAMLEMSQDANITLSQHEFDQLVMDQWTWKGAFEMASSMYNNKYNNKLGAHQ